MWLLSTNPLRGPDTVQVFSPEMMGLLDRCGQPTTSRSSPENGITIRCPIGRRRSLSGPERGSPNKSPPQRRTLYSGEREASTVCSYRDVVVTPIDDADITPFSTIDR